jgi:hypothetical protein
MLPEMRQSLNQGGSEHTTDSCITVEEKNCITVEEKKQGNEELAKQRARSAGLIRSRSIIIAVQSSAGESNRRGSLTFSNSVRQLSRAGTSSRRQLVTGESSGDTSAEEQASFSNSFRQLSSAEEQASFSNSFRQLSRAGTSRRHLAPSLPERSTDNPCAA